MGAGDASLIQTPTHHIGVGRGVAMRGRDLSVTEPRLDGQQVHSGLQQRHCQRVPQDVRRHQLGDQFGNAGFGCFDSGSHDMCCPEAYQAFAMPADEERLCLIGLKAAFSQHSFQRFDEIVGQQHGPIFATLAT